ncbi:MAG: DUF2085 domain-containing protein [Anaerolineales bacterium]|nr:DUF2085 domain-containing protein [Anaerolineales bacterium]
MTSQADEDREQTHSSVEPDTDEILAEVQRRLEAPKQPLDERQQRVVVLADRIVFWLTKHWLAVFSALALLYVGLPFLAPMLMAMGAERPASVLYSIYRPLCHQLPQRSWFLFGPQAAYSLPELYALVGSDVLSGQWSGAFVGTEAMGFKVALCQRDVAIYGAILLSGLVFGLARKRWKVPGMPLWAYLLFGVLPMLIDGGYQWLTYMVVAIWPQAPIAPHETTPLLRTITGALFGFSTVWLAYPHVEATMMEFRQNLQQRFGWV